MNDNSNTVKGILKKTVYSNNSYREVADFPLEDFSVDNGSAMKLADELEDIDSLPYYVWLLKHIPQAKLFEALSITKYKSHKGLFSVPKKFYFRGILKKWGYPIRSEKNER